MITIQDIYNEAVLFINTFLKKEFVEQGHHLTGALEESLDGLTVSRGKTDELQGFANHYSVFVERGVPAKSASMKQFPFVVRYFMQRGLSEKEARGAAAATIHKWMKEGMSTAASKRFSSTGNRQGFIADAFLKNNTSLDSYMSNSFDVGIELLYRKEKSETI